MSGSSTFSYTVRSPIRLKLWKMKPTSRLRTRARSESDSAVAGSLVQHVGAVGRRVEQAEDRQQRRLAAARRPGNRHVLALGDLDVDVVERVRFHFVRVERPSGRLPA